jgi:UDP-N-acetyl-D-mannosaminuronic acid dehydrogenase
MPAVRDTDCNVVVVGGCGHVGLPLGLALASRGCQITLYDTSIHAVDKVNRGEMPFLEPGAPELLSEVLGRSLRATTDPHCVGEADVIIVIIGTPVDEHQNPEPHKVVAAVEGLIQYCRSDQLWVLRSTVYPGTTRLVEDMFERFGVSPDVAFCPERIAEGKALTELFELPQIVSARSERGFDRASALFRRLTKNIVRLQPEEAELAKLFTNAWRYIKFAAANQFFMLAQSFGVDYETVRRGLATGYPRASDLPRAGFAAGPCLLKDTQQLNSFNNNQFLLGQAAMSINEGLPLYLVSEAERRYGKLSELTVGILGMAFKGESDDSRSSLSYKLKRVLRYRAKAVLTTDPYVQGDGDILPLADVLKSADLLFVGAPHRVYSELKFDVPVVDVWSVLNLGTGL